MPVELDFKKNVRLPQSGHGRCRRSGTTHLVERAVRAGWPRTAADYSGGGARFNVRFDLRTSHIESIKYFRES